MPPFVAQDPAWWFDVAVDGCFVVDVLLRFRTGYRTESGALVLSRKLIAREYATGWFVVDFAASFPIDVVLQYTLTDPGDSSQLDALKLLRSVRLVRLLRMLRLFKLGRLVQRLQDDLVVNPAWLKIGAVLARITFITHVFACVWHGIALGVIGGGTDEGDALVEAIGTLDAAASAELRPTWLTRSEILYADKTVASRYLASMYFVFTTMSTIGYGEIAANNVAERLIAIVIMIIGASFFGVITGNMTTLVANIDLRATLSRQKLDVVGAYCREAAMPKPLYRRVQQFYRYYLAECFDVTAEQQILQELAPPLRLAVLSALNRHILERIDFFQGLDPAFLSSVCRVLEPSFAAPQD